MENQCIHPWVQIHTHPQLTPHWVGLSEPTVPLNVSKSNCLRWFHLISKPDSIIGRHPSSSINSKCVLTGLTRQFTNGFPGKCTIVVLQAFLNQRAHWAAPRTPDLQIPEGYQCRSGSVNKNWKKYNPAFIIPKPQLRIWWVLTAEIRLKLQKEAGLFIINTDIVGKEQ